MNNNIFFREWDFTSGGWSSEWSQVYSNSVSSYLVLFKPLSVQMPTKYFNHTFEIVQNIKLLILCLLFSTFFLLRTSNLWGKWYLGLQDYRHKTNLMISLVVSLFLQNSQSSLPVHENVFRKFIFQLFHFHLSHIFPLTNKNQVQVWNVQAISHVILLTGLLYRSKLVRVEIRTLLELSAKENVEQIVLVCKAFYFFHYY